MWVMKLQLPLNPLINLMLRTFTVLTFSVLAWAQDVLELRERNYYSALIGYIPTVCWLLVRWWHEKVGESTWRHGRRLEWVLIDGAPEFLQKTRLFFSPSNCRRLLTAEERWWRIHWSAHFTKHHWNGIAQWHESDRLSKVLEEERGEKKGWRGNWGKINEVNNCFNFYPTTQLNRVKLLANLN